MGNYNVSDVNINKGGLFGDYATFNDNSTNITNNYNIRINLQDRAKTGKTYEYTLFCLHEYNKQKNIPKDITRVTCINVHSENMFVSDHIHIDFPKRMYDDLAYNYSVMKIKAKAYKYKRKNGTYDYGLLVTKVESAVNRIGHYSGRYGCKSLIKLSEDKKDFYKYIYLNDISQQYLSEILSQQINYLEGIIAESNCIYSGFLFNMIATYYFANDYKHELETKSLYLCNLDRDILIDLLQLFSKIIFNINNGETFMWRHVMQEVNELCNVLQGVIKDVRKIKSTDKDESSVKVNKNISEFADKIYSKETRKIFNKIKLRNEDFEYQYPKNINKFKEQLHDYVIWYMFNQKYFDANMYHKDWKEDLQIRE